MENKLIDFYSEIPKLLNPKISYAELKERLGVVTVADERQLVSNLDSLFKTHQIHYVEVPGEVCLYKNFSNDKKVDNYVRSHRNSLLRTLRKELRRGYSSDANKLIQKKITELEMVL